MEDNCFQTKFFDEASDHLLGFVVVSVHDEDFSASIKLHWREVTLDSLEPLPTSVSSGPNTKRSATLGIVRSLKLDGDWSVSNSSAASAPRSL